MPSFGTAGISFPQHCHLSLEWNWLEGEAEGVWESLVTPALHRGTQPKALSAPPRPAHNYCSYIIKCNSKVLHKAQSPFKSHRGCNSKTQTFAATQSPPGDQGDKASSAPAPAPTGR